MVRLLRRTALRTFGHLMPSTAANWFERMVLKPRHAPRLEGIAFPAGGERARIPYGNGWISARVWGEGLTVMLMHGWGGTSNSMAAFVTPLRAAGYRVVAYDAPAHGESDGERTNLVESAGAALQVGRAFGPLHAVVAHSFGGPTAALATTFGLAFERLVLLGPPMSIFDLTMEMGEMLGLPRHVVELMTARVADRLRIDWKELRTEHLVARLDAPLLVVHDREDRIVPWDHGRTIAHAAKHGMLHSTTGLGHRQLLADDAVIEQVVNFVAALGARAAGSVAPDRPVLAIRRVNPALGAGSAGDAS